MGRYDQKDLPSILGQMDVLVIPSTWHETFSLVAREGLLSGTPVIASEIGALPEVINSGQNGLLVPPGDVDALHGALHNLSADPALLAHLREGAILSAKEIKSMEDHVREVDLIYQALVSNSRGSVTTGASSLAT